MITTVSNFGAIIPVKSDQDFSGGKVGRAAPFSSAVGDFTNAFAASIKSIIGSDDDRTPILNTRRAPFRMIAALTLNFGPDREPFHATGWLAGPRLIVTAGHCLLDATMGWVRSVTIDAGRNGDGLNSKPFGSIIASRFSVSEAWQQRADPALDIGCIFLDRNIDEMIGWFAFGLPPGTSSIQTGLALHSAGYSDYFAKNSIPTRSPGMCVGTARGRLFYTLDTLRGASGAPVMLASDLSRAVAIHAYNEDESVPEVTKESNSGPLLAVELVDLINRWNAASLVQ